MSTFDMKWTNYIPSCAPSLKDRKLQLEPFEWLIFDTLNKLSIESYGRYS